MGVPLSRYIKDEEQCGEEGMLMHPRALWLCLLNLTSGSGPVSYVHVHVMLMLVYFTWTELSHKLGVRRTLGGLPSAFCSITHYRIVTPSSVRCWNTLTVKCTI